MDRFLLRDALRGP